MYIHAQLRILQSLFQKREGIVVATANRIIIMGYNFYSRLDGFFRIRLCCRVALPLAMLTMRSVVRTKSLPYLCPLTPDGVSPLPLSASLVSGEVAQFINDADRRHVLGLKTFTYPSVPAGTSHLSPPAFPGKCKGSPSY